ncbi:MAG: hypothetical protein HY925_12580 [Elusimicrobia bacterium]|nr:hypothetical protein [Elusimicrobiota bacterium]
MPLTQSRPLNLDSVGYVVFFVKEALMEKTISFYRDTLGLKGRIDPHWSEFDLKGDLKLALHHEAEGKAGPGATEVVFSVADPLSAREALVERGVAVDAPKVVFEAGPMCGVSCIFRDPAGNLLSVYGMVPTAKMKK